MPSEASRGLTRILTNYVRLTTNLALGLILVPVLISWLTLEGFGLVALVGVSAGFAGIFREFTEQSLIRELGTAYHSGDPQHFRTYYSSAYVVTIVVSALTAIAFVIVLAVLPLLKIPPDWIPAGRWIVASQGVFSCLYVLVSPAFSMYLVQERFAAYNFWQICIRAAALVPALVLAFGVGITDIPLALKSYGLAWSGCLCVVAVLAVALIVRRDRRLHPRIDLINRAAIRQISHTFGWSSVVHLAMNMHPRFAQLLMNLFFGVFGNAVFALAYRLTSYVRMAASGITTGLDAVSARVSTTTDTGVKRLMHHATKLQAVVALPGGLTVFVLADPLLRLWVGRQVDDPEASIPPAVVIVQILAIAIASRSVSHGWMLILYGAGHVRRYAPLIIAGGVTSPLVGAALLFILPEGSRMYAPALGLSGILFLVNFLILPAIGARCLGISYGDLFTPLIRPAIVTLASSPVLLVPWLMIEEWSLLKLLATGIAFGACYGIGTWFVVLRHADRERLLKVARSRWPGKQKPEAL